MLEVGLGQRVGVRSQGQILWSGSGARFRGLGLMGSEALGQVPCQGQRSGLERNPKPPQWTYALSHQRAYNPAQSHLRTYKSSSNSWLLMVKIQSSAHSQ